MPKRPMTQVPTNKTADGPPSGLPERLCMCGCGVSFTPLRSNHWFIDDHRFVTYQSHACPDCGSTHRIAVKRDLCKVCGLHYGAHHSTSVGDDPRDSSIDIVREQRQ